MTPETETNTVDLDERTPADEEAIAKIGQKLAKAADKAEEPDPPADPDPAAETAEQGEGGAPDTDTDEDADPELSALVERAIDAGMSDEDIDSHDDVAALEQAVALLEKRTPAAADDSSDDDDEPSEMDAIDFGLDSEFLDPDVAKTLKQMQAHYDARIGELTTQLASAKSVIDEQAADASARRFDSFIGDLDKSRHKLFGEGHTVDLDPKSDVYKNRKTVQDEMSTLVAGLEARGKAVPEERVLFNKALAATFGDEIKKIDADRQRNRIKRRQSQMIAKPTTRTTDGRSPEERAMNLIAEKMASSVQ